MTDWVRDRRELELFLEREGAKLTDRLDWRSSLHVDGKGV